MSIYTRSGDTGTTDLFGGKRVKKYDLHVDTYGTIDELNASVSVATQFVQGTQSQQQLITIQQQLFYFAAEIACEDRQQYYAKYKSITSEDIQHLEKSIDACMLIVGKPEGFVLLGQTRGAAFLHQSRTVARRAERLLVELNEQTPLRPQLLQYLNRLSDLFYAMAREQDQLAHNEQMINEIVRRYQQATQSSSTQCSPTPTLSAPSTSLNFIAIHDLLKNAVQAALDRQLAVVIAVVDQHGKLIIHYRMPDALLVSIDMAMKKAYSAVAMKTATHLLQELTQPGAELYQLEAMTNGKIVTFGGGYPLYLNGHLVGGLGVSGASIAEDMQIAELALQHFNDKANSL